MKKIVPLIGCLVLINNSCICGLAPQRPRRDFLSETNHNNSALQQRAEAPSYSMVSRERSKEELGVFFCAFAPFMGNLILPMALLQLSDTTNCKQTVCFNSAMSNLFWAFFAENTAVLLYEMYNRKPFLTSHKKNRILGGVNCLVPAVLWACSSMVDDCPQNNPYCLQGRQFFCSLYLLAAGLRFYEASLNK